jgi:hypothetical protein
MYVNWIENFAGRDFGSTSFSLLSCEIFNPIDIHPKKLIKSDWKQCHFKARAIRAAAQGPQFTRSPEAKVFVAILNIKTSSLKDLYDFT